VVVAIQPHTSEQVLIELVELISLEVKACEFILTAEDHLDWHLCDFFKWDQISDVISSDAPVLRELLISVLEEVLAIVLQGLCWCCLQS